MNNFYLYTETAYHHQGSMDYMKSLIDATVESGANGIKFQVLTRPEDTISTKHPAFKELASYCFTYDDWKEILKYTRDNGLDIIMMPINQKALDLAREFQIRYIDIHSVSFNDSELHDKIRYSGVDVILGVGGRTIEEIIKAKNFFKNQLKVLMVGFQSFPTKLEDAKLSKISVLKMLFPELRIGYADHSNFKKDHAVSSNEYARILGAEIFEKHITTKEGLDRLDSQAAVSKEKIREIIEKLQFLEENVLLSPEDSISMNEAERTYRNRQLRCVATREIEAGEIIDYNDISLKMVENQENAFSEVQHLVGKKVSRRIEYDETIFHNSIKPAY